MDYSKVHISKLIVGATAIAIHGISLNFSYNIHQQIDQIIRIVIHEFGKIYNTNDTLRPSNTLIRKPTRY